MGEGSGYKAEIYIQTERNMIYSNVRFSKRLRYLSYFLRPYSRNVSGNLKLYKQVFKLRIFF